jgi:uncharacterized protein
MVYRILSIDGGGIRGVIPAVMLLQIEKIIQKHYQQTIFDYFDMFVGTSTGSIIASSLVAQKNIQSILEVYRQKGKIIFPYQSRWSLQRIGLVMQYGISAPKYSNQGLIEVISEQFQDLKFRDISDNKRLLITSYDTESRQPVIFDNLSQELDVSQITLAEACICSSSAPTFFPAYDLKIGEKRFSAIDGGVVANNPTAYAVAKAINAGHPISELQVLSLGTGDPTRPIPLKNAQEWGALEWAIPIIDVFFDGASDINHSIVKEIIDDSKYLRLQFRLKDKDLRLNDDMDDASQENINNLIKATKIFTERNHRVLESFLR